MSDPSIDIIVTVWNRPVETRNCLVNLIDHSPDARFILVDNGSDRDTERLLQEFAEILDKRALLLRNDTNQGYVRAVNRGLDRTEAPHIAIIRNSSIVTNGWLEPLLNFSGEKSEAGIIVPRLIPAGSGKPGRNNQDTSRPIEVDTGSFAAMILKRRVYDSIGGFDEDMDSGTWCLRDFSRRAYRAGFFTFRIETGTVGFENEILFGSPERREQAVRRSITAYCERWGENGSFYIHFPKGADMNILRQKFDLLLQGARQGHAFTILLHPRLYKELSAAGCLRFHENIRLIRLPLIFETRTIKDLFAKKIDTNSAGIAVAGIDGIPFPAGIESISFSQLERDIVATQTEKYGG
jgi:glycosyltransferase involved in cell wall biosynthesis